ncbi:MAG: DUF465 domain-containing protein [Deltaproteobacteria bacterium]|nr:DUF465 domain-containing protein [Deltaproteobacteria bacterium]
MEKQDQKVVERLVETDPEFKRKYKTHKDYENKLEKLEKKPRLTATETLEKNRLKKLKLALKDEMKQRIAEYLDK